MLDGSFQEAQEEVHASGPRSNAEADNSITMRSGVGVEPEILPRSAMARLLSSRKSNVMSVPGAAV